MIGIIFKMSIHKLIANHLNEAAAKMTDVQNSSGIKIGGSLKAWHRSSYRSMKSLFRLGREESNGNVWKIK